MNFIDIVWLVAGLVMILYGANILTDGASAIAKRFGLSDLVVGLTVVAFGTSAPELVISILSATGGSAGLAIGNVVGSNIFNILVIIGVTSLIHPIKVERTVMTREIPMVVISSAVLLLLGNSAWVNGVGGESEITRVSGIMLLTFFGIFMWYTFAAAKQADPSEPIIQKGSDKEWMSMWKASFLTIGGLALLIYGGDRFVAGATAIARTFGISDAIIGITIASVGTSLPELATSIVAALKGKTGLAVGNVIGSNIFNVFLILGSAATICPMKFNGIGNLDLLTLMGASVLFLLFGWFFGDRTFTRAEGTLLTLTYVGYITAALLTL